MQHTLQGSVDRQSTIGTMMEVNVIKRQNQSGLKSEIIINQLKCWKKLKMQIAQKLGTCKLCIHLRCGKGTDLIFIKKFNSTL